jgi:fatty acid-binding protein DegV
MSAVAVVVDADACVPERLLRDLAIVTAPQQAALLVDAESPAKLRGEQAPASPDDAVAACIEAARGSDTVIYVGCNDGYSGGPGLVDAARMALAARGFEALVSVPIEKSLMGTGWAAIAAAATVRAGGSPGEAIAEAQRVGSTVQVLGLIEEPALAGIGRGMLGAMRPARALVRLSGSEIEVLSRPRARDAGLVALRDLLAVEVGRGSGLLRLAVHHASAGAAGQAMLRWAERELSPEEAHLAPLTRHAATRLSPGFVGFAWYHDTEARP